MLLRSARERLRVALEGGCAVSQEVVDVFETDLHATCIEAACNRRLAETVRLLQISLVINRLAEQQFHRPWPRLGFGFGQGTPQARIVERDKANVRGGTKQTLPLQVPPPAVDLLARDLMALRNLGHRRAIDPYRMQDRDLRLLAPPPPTLNAKNAAAHH